MTEIAARRAISSTGKMGADEERDAAGRGAAHGATSAGEQAGADVARLSRSGTRRGEDAGLGSREIIARLLVDAGIGALMEAHALVYACC